MDKNPYMYHRKRQSLNGPRNQRTPSPPRPQNFYTMPSTEVSAAGLRHGYPEMMQTSSKSPFSPSSTARHAEHRQPRNESPRRGQPPQDEVANPASENGRVPSSPSRSSSRYVNYRDRHYPHAPPPARHRSRSPVNSPPPFASRMDSETTHPDEPSRHNPPPPSTTAKEPSDPSRRAARFSSASLYPGMLQHRDPRRLLPTPVRPPVAFTFELAPSQTEFFYTLPEIPTQDDVDAVPPPTSDPVLEPVPNTAYAISNDHFGHICSNPETFTDSRRMPKEMAKDPNARAEFARPFLYESGVDHENGESQLEDEMPSSPPVVDQFMAFEEGRMQGCGTIRQVTEDDEMTIVEDGEGIAGQVEEHQEIEDSSVYEMPGAWRTSSGGFS